MLSPEGLETKFQDMIALRTILACYFLKLATPRGFTPESPDNSQLEIISLFSSLSVCTLYYPLFSTNQNIFMTLPCQRLVRMKEAP